MIHSFINEHNNMKLSVFRLLLYILLGAIALVPLGYYVWWFRDASISNDPSDWASFGSYIGGLYSVLVAVLVVYLARDLSKRDEVASKKKAAVEALYLQILKVKNDHIDIRSVSKIYNLLEENKLYITDTIYEEVKDLADYYQEVKSGRPVDFKKEDLVKEHLRAIYNA